MMPLPTLETLAARAGHLAPSAGPPEEKLLQGLLSKAADRLARQDPVMAYQILAGARRRLGCMPLAILAPLLALARELKREQAAAHECLQFAGDAFALGYDDLALEAAAAAFILDAQGDYELTAAPPACARMAAQYEQVAQKMRPGIPPRGGAPAGDEQRPLHIGMLVPNLVDQVVAYSRCVLFFARFVDPASCRLHVYVSENHAARKAPLFPFGCIDCTSEERGAASLAELRRRQVPVHLGVRDAPYTRSARLLAEAFERDRLDALIVQSGLSAPIDWLAVRIAQVPVKLAIHIGTSLFMPGLDATFYDNPANLQREAEAWPATAGERRLLPQGTDVEWVRAQAPLVRTRFGIPAGAVVLGTLSNHLERRLSAPYMEAIARVLQANPQAWFLALGADMLPEKQACFDRLGVGARVRFGGRQPNAPAALKVLDIYANEFPVGGSQSVVEAMACGLPVVAMNWSQVHAESAGAALVGPAFSIEHQDVAAYVARLDAWVKNHELRRRDGATLAAHAAQHLSVSAYVRKIIAAVSHLLRARACA